VRLVLICGGWIVDREEGLLCLLLLFFGQSAATPLFAGPFYITRSTSQRAISDTVKRLMILPIIASDNQKTENFVVDLTFFLFKNGDSRDDRPE
jgi:hypothetical protein